MEGPLTELAPLAQLLAAFTAGIAVSFTPCVYPLIPVTLALFGASESSSRKRSFLLALTYVLGIAVTYTSLGVFSAQTGSLFGSFLGNTWVIIALSFFILGLCLYTLEILHIPGIERLQQKAGNIGGKGFLGAFLMGAASGIVAAPCVGPFLIAILVVAAKSQDAWWGGALLLSYSLGFGLLFLALGTFAPLLQRLPKSGNWLYGVKILIAAALVMMGLFLAAPLGWWKPFAPFQREFWPLWLALLLTALLAAKFALPKQAKGKAFLSVLGIGFSLYLLCIPLPDYSAPGKALTIDAEKLETTPEKADLFWHEDFEAASQASAKSGNILMVDLYADWCAACKEFDALTFAAPAVKKELAELTLARLDFTEFTDEVNAFSDKYDILGLPVILFFHDNGEEIPKSRITGFLPPAEFLEHVRKVQEDAL